MKTPLQIKEWLESQEWYDEYLENVTCWSKTANVSVRELIEGRQKENTISRAFVWQNCPQGFSTWKLRNDEFLKWYDGN